MATVNEQRFYVHVESIARSLETLAATAQIPLLLEALREKQTVDRRKKLVSRLHRAYDAAGIPQDDPELLLEAQRTAPRTR